MMRAVIKIQTVKARSSRAYRLHPRSRVQRADRRRASKALESSRSRWGGGMRGLVLDLRNNPGGLLDQAVAVSDVFLDEGEIVSTRGRHLRTASDGTRGAAKSPRLADGGAGQRRLGLGERDRRGRPAGPQPRRDARHPSFGKGSVQTVIPLPGNGAMRLTTARYYTPSGRSIQGLGIAPDIEVQASRTDVPRFGPERESDLNHVLSKSRWDAATIRAAPDGPAPDREGRREQAARELPAIRSHEVGYGFPAATGACGREGHGGAETRRRELTASGFARAFPALRSPRLGLVLGRNRRRGPRGSGPVASAGAATSAEAPGRSGSFRASGS